MEKLIIKKQLDVNRNEVKLSTQAHDTNYEILAIYKPYGINLGFMQNPEPVILVISGYDKTAYAFALNHWTSWDYVLEKLSRAHNRTDSIVLTELINEAKNHFKELNP